MSVNSPIRILLVDDSPYFLEVARDFLHMQEAFQVSGVAVEGRSALEQARQIQPHVILLDLNLGTQSGIRLIPLFKRQVPLSKIIVLTIMDGEGYQSAALQAGADAFVVKTRMTEELVAIIMQMMNGEEIQRGKNPEPETLNSVIHGLVEPGHTDQWNLLQNITDNSNTLIYALDSEGRFLLINKKLEAVLGVPRETLIGKSRETVLSPDIARAHRANDLHVIETGQPSTVEEENLQADGKHVYLSTKFPLFNENGDVFGIGGISSDITARKGAEILLKESERFTRETLDALDENIAILDETGVIMAVNRAWREFARANGADPAAVSEGVDYLAVCDTANGKDSEAAAAAAGIRAVMRGECKTFALEYPCHSPDENRWFLMQVTRFSGEGPVRVVVAHEKITERKLSEQSALDSEAHYRELFIANPHPMWVYDLETFRFLAVNDAAVLHYGYTRDEFLGMTIKDIRPTEDVPLLMDSTSLAVEKVYKAGVWRHVRKDGAVILVEISSHVLVFDGHKAKMVLAHDVTERLRTEESLRESEVRYRGIFDGVQEAIFVESPDGDILDVNESACRMFGWTREEFLHMKVDDLVPEGRKALMLNELGQGGLSEDFVETVNRRADGGQVPVEVNGRMLNLGDKPTLLVVVRDISERKRSEEQIRRRMVELEALYQSGIALSQTLDPQWIGSKIVQVLEQHLNWHHAAVRVRRGEGSDLDLLAFSHMATPEEDARFSSAITRVGQGMAGWVIEHGEPIRSNHIAHDPRYMATFAGMSSGIYIPIMVQGRTMGCISAESDRENAFSEEDERLLTTLAGQAAVALENARLFQELQIELKERRSIHDALQASEERLRLSLSAANQGLYDLNVQTGEAVVNREYAEMLGYDAETFVETNQAWIERLHPDDREGTAKAYVDYIDGLLPDYRVEFRQRTRDGGWKWILSLGRVVEYDAEGRPLRMLGTHTDITARKLTEQALKESETRYRSLLDQLPAVVYLDDARQSQPNTLFVSPRIREMLGYTPEEWLAGGFDMWKQTIHPDDLERVLGHYLDCIANSMPYSQEYRMFRRDGTMIWVRDSATTQQDENGKTLSLQGLVSDITEIKSAENTLRLQSAALEAADNAIVLTDIHGNIQWVNPAFTRLTGYASEEIVGKNPRLLQSGMQDDAFYKDLWSTILAGGVWHGELTNRRKDGTLYHEEQTITPLRDTAGTITHFVGIKQNVTSRKQADDKIRQQVEHLSALREIDQAIASSFDMRVSLKVILMKTLNLLKVDAASVLLLNRESGTLEYAAGQGFRARFPESTSVKVSESYAGRAVLDRRMVSFPNLANEPENKFTTGFLREDGFVGYHCLPLIVKGQVAGALEVFHRSVTHRDEAWLDFFGALAGQAAIAIDNAQLFSASQRELTERKMAEEKLRVSNSELEKRIEERTADLRQVNFELERALRVKDEFLANMSHELRTPLNAVIGLSDSLAEQTAGPLNDKQEKYVGTIRESGQHLLELINDILDLAKIEAGQVTLSQDTVNIATVGQSSLRMVRQLALKKNQEVSLKLDPDLDTIRADERRLKQMIVNLLGNAVKFTPEKGKLGLEVRGDRGANVVRFIVWDTGIGIEEKDLPRLFKPFVQLDANLARKSSGTGLGLALVAKMASMHGGSVSVESQPGEGSRFTITLPWITYQSGETYDSQSTAKLQVTKPLATNRDHTILLVDDTEEVVMVIRDYLEYAGFNVVTARNGLDGIAQAEKLNPSLILMDIQMPVMDGLEATRRIRAINSSLERTPIIALTALAMKGDRERCLAAGMNEYISKPVNLRALISVIQAQLSRAKPERL